MWLLSKLRSKAEAFSDSVRPASLEIFDLGSRLHLRISRQRSWIQTLLTCCITGFALWQAQKLHSKLWFAGVVLSMLYGVADLVQGRETNLFVSEEGLEARGNLGRLLRTEMQVAAKDITFLQYDSGGEDQASGLYAKRCRGSICILPNVSESLCRDIFRIVYSRFPNFATGDQDATSLIYGKKDDPITLKLSQP